ncbi:reverse transcriptase [Phytophthora megakarya]|uniref:Reverse transcriptase n=1 Tax=Phytophthora megakarya TaxID=4795 RepID=A0A225UTE2_9STRA|nr:reverse transcriptase [Phytophthora megakarya]
MQSFLGSLNYYSRFIEDFAVYATILYELREADFHEIAAIDAEETWVDDSQITGGERDSNSTTPVIVLYANKWAISAALMQEHEGVYHPVTFTSRTLKANELNNGVVDKEVLALLRMDVCYSQLVTRSIKVLSRFSTLAWLLKSNGFDGRLGRWAVLLSGWTLEVTKCVKGEGEILGTIAASITPRAEVDEALVAIAPKTQARKMITMPPPTIEPDENFLVMSFDGSARVKRSGVQSLSWAVSQCTTLRGGMHLLQNRERKATGQGDSPENIQGTYPFQVISMDHIPSLPKSSKETPNC